MKPVEELIDEEYDKFNEILAVLEPGDKHTIKKIVDLVIGECTNSFTCYLVAAVLYRYLEEYGEETIKDLQDPERLKQILRVVQEERNLLRRGIHE